MAKKGDSETLPILFRQAGHPIVRAITVFIGKECGYKRITPELKLFTIHVLSDMCEGYKDRNTNWKPDYHSGISNYFNKLWEKVKEADNDKKSKRRKLG